MTMFDSHKNSKEYRSGAGNIFTIVVTGRKGGMWDLGERGNLSLEYTRSQEGASFIAQKELQK